jgi:two-component system, LytTR family, sensor kinase
MEANRTFAQPPRWFWIAAVWGALGLFDATQSVFTMRSQGMHHDWPRLFLTLLISWLPWALATPLVWRMGHRFPPTRLRPFSAWLVHAGLYALIGLLAAAWIAGLDKLLNPWAHSRVPPFLPLWRGQFVGSLLSYLIFYTSIVAVSYVLESKERLSRQQTETARLNEQLSRAQLYALRRQIEPHFLFNSLNAVAGLVREGRNDAAVIMIAELSDLLRRVLEDSNRQEIPLEEEMVFVEKYLDIQKVRFAERLQTRVDVPQEFRQVRVPSLILQPMVENAVKHGIARRAQGGEVRISAQRSNDMLTLSVYNDGPQLPLDWETTGSGIGIANVRSRLQSLYGDGFDLKMRNLEPGGVEVSVSVPFRER